VQTLTAQFDTTNDYFVKQFIPSTWERKPTIMGFEKPCDFKGREAVWLSGPIDAGTNFPTV
jgi:hypothetical protein